MHLAIDATNIRNGGGVTHLAELLRSATPIKSGIRNVSVWASDQTLNKLPDRPWLTKRSTKWANYPIISSLGQQVLLSREISNCDCDLLFSPGGIIIFGLKIPTITMSQNMLPFELDRSMLFGLLSPVLFKMIVLRLIQSISFKKASGIIFLTDYARNTIANKISLNSTVVIPHGIERRFGSCGAQSEGFSTKADDPIKLLYVSIQMPYKHHIELIKAVHELRKKNFNVELTLIGPHWGWYSKKIYKLIKKCDPLGEFIKDEGLIPFSRLHVYYNKHDIFVFPSSCENMPNILIEAMASGLPIVCSDRGPMPELLGDGGQYFDPESIDSIVSALDFTIEKKLIRENKAKKSFFSAKRFSWEKCASDTLSFISSFEKAQTR
jgi:glycosyltransferase involved in cell wall biosynthesis